MTGFGTAQGKAQPLSVSRPSAALAELIASVFPEDLLVAASHAGLEEDQALGLLHRNDLPPTAFEALARNPVAIKSRKTLLKLVQHVRVPRHVALPVLRRLFAFELMDVALSPTAAADLKLVAEQLLIDKLEAISLGERINMARRASAGIASALLLQSERTVIEAALQNPRMTEAGIVKAVSAAESAGTLIEIVVEHTKWSLRREIQLAVLRRPEAPEAIVMQVARTLPRPVIYELLKELRLPERKAELQRCLLEG
ncbi:MAG TPA: hypothetical protein VJR04_11535 [Terriglobales bacterium]|nr:hypothetical protein [Terriglobales bacterium]